MLEETQINSPQNPRVKNLVRLREGKHRRRQGCYLIEGLRELRRAIDNGAGVTEFYACEELWNDPAALELAEDIDGRAEIQKFQLAEQAFRKASARDNPDGLLAVAQMPQTGLDGLKLSDNPLILLLEHVEKPGNLGTLLRNADAAGADAVIVSDPVTDLFSPNAIRSSQGSIFSLPCVVTDNDTALEWLIAKGFKLVATTPDATALHWEVDMSGPAALLMGSEAKGLSDVWLKHPEVQGAKIPMRGAADSLNVSAAAAVFLFEVVRQRAAARS